MFLSAAISGALIGTVLSQRRAGSREIDGCTPTIATVAGRSDRFASKTMAASQHCLWIGMFGWTDRWEGSVSSDSGPLAVFGAETIAASDQIGAMDSIWTTPAGLGEKSIALSDHGRHR
jgi:hypothetical protein